MAVVITDFNETEAFEEYSTDPYRGGYDIVLTYGIPLPPSAAICYPAADASSNLPPNPQMPLPSIPQDPPALHETTERANSNSVEIGDELSEREYDSSFGYGEQGFTSVEWWWNVYGLSPYMMTVNGNGLGCGRYDAEELRYLGQLRRAADYIFGFSQGFGEKRIGEDCYGIPIYACRRHVSDTVHTEMEPARTEKLDYHCDAFHHEGGYSTCSDRDDESSRFSNLSDVYVKHHHEEQLHTEVDPVDIVFSWNPSQLEPYDDQVNPERAQVPLTYDESKVEVNVYENLGMDYNKHYYGGAINVQLEAVESSYKIMNHPEANQEVSYIDSNSELSYQGHEIVNSTYSNFCYEGREYQHPSHVDLDPYRPSWAQYPGYYGTIEDAYSGSHPIAEKFVVFHEPSSPTCTSQASSLDEWDNVGRLCTEHAFQTHHDNDCLELEPFMPTWMLNPNYYDAYEEISKIY